jgi:hypothetical protein
MMLQDACGKSEAIKGKCVCFYDLLKIFGRDLNFAFVFMIYSKYFDVMLISLFFEDLLKIFGHDVNFLQMQFSQI